MPTPPAARSSILSWEACSWCAPRGRWLHDPLRLNPAQPAPCPTLALPLQELPTPPAGCCMCTVRGQPAQRLGAGRWIWVVPLTSTGHHDGRRWLTVANSCAVGVVLPVAGEGWFGPQPPDAKTPTYLTRVRVGKVTTGATQPRRGVQSPPRERADCSSVALARCASLPGLRLSRKVQAHSQPAGPLNPAAQAGLHPTTSRAATSWWRRLQSAGGSPTPPPPSSW